jgi:hypothetical protein
VELSSGFVISSWVVRFPLDVSASRPGKAGRLGEVMRRLSAP